MTESLDKSLSGDYTVNLDEAGRIAIPKELRKALESGQVVVTRGVEPCIWLYPADSWKSRLQELVRGTDPDSAKGRNIRRKFIARAHTLDIDKQGRVLLPQLLREYAGITGECLVLGQFDYVEIWEKERYASYECADEDYQQISEAFAQEKELKNAGNSAHSGTFGGNDRISRSEGQG